MDADRTSYCANRQHSCSVGKKETYVSNEYHASLAQQIKESFNLANLAKHVVQLLRISSILLSSVSITLRQTSQVERTLTFLTNKVRHSLSLTARDSMRAPSSALSAADLGTKE